MKLREENSYKGKVDAYTLPLISLTFVFNIQHILWITVYAYFTNVT